VTTPREWRRRPPPFRSLFFYSILFVVASALAVSVCRVPILRCRTARVASHVNRCLECDGLLCFFKLRLSLFPCGRAIFKLVGGGGERVERFDNKQGGPPFGLFVRQSVPVFLPTGSNSRLVELRTD
jgi:hypothetical protein